MTATARPLLPCGSIRATQIGSENHPAQPASVLTQTSEIKKGLSPERRKEQRGPKKTDSKKGAEDRDRDERTNLTTEAQTATRSGHTDYSIKKDRKSGTEKLQHRERKRRATKYTRGRERQCKTTKNPKTATKKPTNPSAK